MIYLTCEGLQVRQICSAGNCIRQQRFIMKDNTRTINSVGYLVERTCNAKDRDECPRVKPPFFKRNHD